MTSKQVSWFTVAAVALLLITALGCASTGWQDSAKKAVVASAQVYDLAMHIAGSSSLSASKQAEIVRVANVYRAAASAALAAADVNDQASYNAHVAEFAKAIADLTALINGHASLRSPRTFRTLEDAIAADRKTFRIPVGGQA